MRWPAEDDDPDFAELLPSVSSGLWLRRHFRWLRDLLTSYGFMTSYCRPAYFVKAITTKMMLDNVVPDGEYLLVADPARLVYEDKRPKINPEMEYFVAVVAKIIRRETTGSPNNTAVGQSETTEHVDISNIRSINHLPSIDKTPGKEILGKFAPDILEQIGRILGENGLSADMSESEHGVQDPSLRGTLFSKLPNTLSFGLFGLTSQDDLRTLQLVSSATKTGGLIGTRLPHSIRWEYENALIQAPFRLIYLGAFGDLFKQQLRLIFGNYTKIANRGFSKASIALSKSGKSSSPYGLDGSRYQDFREFYLAKRDTFRDDTRNLSDFRVSGSLFRKLDQQDEWMLPPGFDVTFPAIVNDIEDKRILSADVATSVLKQVPPDEEKLIALRAEMRGFLGTRRLHYDFWRVAHKILLDKAMLRRYVIDGTDVDDQIFLREQENPPVQKTFSKESKAGPQADMWNSTVGPFDLFFTGCLEAEILVRRHLPALLEEMNDEKIGSLASDSSTIYGKTKETRQRNEKKANQEREKTEKPEETEENEIDLSSFDVFVEAGRKCLTHWQRHDSMIQNTWLFLKNNKITRLLIDFWIKSGHTPTALLVSPFIDQSPLSHLVRAFGEQVATFPSKFYPQSKSCPLCDARSPSGDPKIRHDEPTFVELQIEEQPDGSTEVIPRHTGALDKKKKPKPTIPTEESGKIPPESGELLSGENLLTKRPSIKVAELPDGVREFAIQARKKDGVSYINIDETIQYLNDEAGREGIILVPQNTRSMLSRDERYKKIRLQAAQQGVPVQTQLTHPEMFRRKLHRTICYPIVTSVVDAARSAGNKLKTFADLVPDFRQTRNRLEERWWKFVELQKQEEPDLTSVHMADVIADLKINGTQYYPFANSTAIDDYLHLISFENGTNRGDDDSVANGVHDGHALRLGEHALGVLKTFLVEAMDSNDCSTQVPRGMLLLKSERSSVQDLNAITISTRIYDAITYNY